MKTLLTFSTIAMFSFSASAFDKTECSNLKKHINKIYKNHLIFNDAWIEAHNIIKKNVRTENDRILLKSHSSNADKNLDLAVKYSTIYNASCKG